MQEDSIKDMFEEIRDALEELVSGIEEAVDEAVMGSFPESFVEGWEQFMADHTFVKKDGTVVQGWPVTRVLSPDKKKQLNCYGGLKVDGRTLIVQTRISSWEPLCTFESEEAAVEALKKISEAMKRGETFIEL
jgi:hypothetical protein